MDTLLIAAGLLSGFIALVHAWLGGREILRPALDSGLGPVVRGTLESGWHLLTWHFLVLGGAALFAVGMPRPTAEAITIVVGASAIGHAVLFLVVGFRRFGDPWHLPQWVLFVPLAGLAFAAPYLDAIAAAPFVVLAAGLGAAIFAVLAALHFAWAAGSAFPCSDRARLAITVVGNPPGGTMPGNIATLVVACALLVAAWWTLALGGLVAAALPPAWLRIGGFAMVAIFALRGVGGFFEVVLRPSIRGTPYLRWNRILYSPIAAVLALLVACAMLA